MPPQRLEKINWISKCVTLCWIFWKKVIKIKYSRSLLDHESSGCGHSQPYKFFSVFADFRTLVDNSVKPKLVDSTQKNFSVTGDRNFQLSPKNRVLEPIEKKSVDCYVYSTILVITKSSQYISSLFYFSFIVYNAKPAWLDCVNSNIYIWILSLLKLHRTFCYMN